MHHGKHTKSFFLNFWYRVRSYTDLCNLFKVGDPKQLPATVLSNVASKFLFECSMFERLQRAGHPVIMLTEQVYRLPLDLMLKYLTQMLLFTEFNHWR